MRNDHTEDCQTRSSNFGGPNTPTKCVTNEAGKSFRYNVNEQIVDESKCLKPYSLLTWCFQVALSVRDLAYLVKNVFKKTKQRQYRGTMDRKSQRTEIF